MHPHNPYAAPDSELDVLPQHCSRDGKFALLPSGCDLPARCIKCNAPVAIAPKKTTLYWHTPWLYLLILLNILIYIIVGLIARRTHAVTPYLCDQHRLRRRRRMQLSFGASLACIALTFVGDHFQSGAVFGLSIFGALIFFIVGLFVSRRLYANKITKEYTRIGGCGEAFLASLRQQ